ncbi:MAG TPA: tripartite tricarboxylate transporter substrate-binding protein [Candidatus Binatia bacterium]|nr:tripartite tricarboxylate transporter substrate-binding protein [Candidatus Binatia bacterium]
MYQRIGNVVSLTVTLALWMSPAVAETPYYQGKTITIVAGTKAGDVYDLYARHFAQFLPKYIPGNPNIIVQNMAGAGSMIAANFVYNVANRDGLTIGAIFPALYFDQVVGRPEVKYDWSKFAWIGSPVTSNHLLYMRADSPYQTINHVVKASSPAKCGATGTSSTAYYVPKLLDEVIGTNFEIILGYQAGQDIDLAVERNEVVCRAFTLTAFFAREPFRTWRKNRFVRVLVQTGRKRDARIKHVPTIYELMEQYKTPDAGRNLATLVLAAGDFGRPYVMPPNTPAEHLKTIRDAFELTLKDEAAIAEAKKKKLEFDPTTGDDLNKLAKEVISQPAEIVAKMKSLLAK